jgi:5-formyltetrahydrofolate cyclo-ligase
MNAAARIKSRLREEMRGRLRAVSADERRVKSLALCNLLLETPFWQRATAILFYAPLPDELDVWPAMLAALAAGKQAALPWHDAASDTYQARLIAAPDTDTLPGRFGIREPRAACPKISLNRLDLALVPGLGFTVAGLRLGRGRGYYDRLLAGFPGFKCGVGFDWQMGLDVPGEGHDVFLNCFITPSQWRLVP